MQAQTTRTDQHQAVITSQQSLQSIQTLLRAGLGCITYLRNLLPSDNFSESYLTSSGPETLSSQPSRTGSSFSSSDARKNVSGFKIMTVTRGFTEEADKLLDYLENGIFDAVSKQYLRSFVFAIYLDDQDPNNIIEAYSFNFTYCQVPGTTEAVPIMTLGEEMMNLSLSGFETGQDPVAEATKRGKIPTLGEVKRSLKTLIKNLIQATTQMDALPKRRFATFKLFYYDNTPDDYEPPHFRAGDANKDKWFMTTHHKGEVPERCSVGFVHTGYHGVDVKVTSVSGYLPTGEDNNAPFMGTTDRNMFAAPPLTPAEEAALRAQQIAAQRQDALERRVVWDGEDRLGNEISARGRPKTDSTVDENLLIGVRDEDGTIIPAASEAQYAGRPESVPACIGQLAKGALHLVREVSPTQELEKTPIVISPLTSARPSPSRSPTPTPQPRRTRRHSTARMGSSLPPSDIAPSSASSLRDAETIDTQMLKDIVMAAAEDDSTMLDMETQQLPEYSSADDPIESFPESEDFRATRGTETPMEQDDDVVRPVECECGVQNEDCDLCACDGGCQRWFHIWRGIKVFETSAPEGLYLCSGCDSTVAGQVFKRLEAEGLSYKEIRETDESGFIETTSLATKRKGKGGKANAKTKAAQRRRNMQKPVYVFVQAIKNEDAYKDYFNPDPEVEKRLLGLSDLKPERKSRRKKHDAIYQAEEANMADASVRMRTGEDPLVPYAAVDETQVLPFTTESQTQHETQASFQGSELKRKTDGEERTTRKKMKISLGPPVDLGD